MKRLTLVLCLLVAPAYAADAPSPIKPTDTFTVALSAAQWNVVIGSVRDSAVISARDGNALATAIQEQIMAKVQPQKK
jgi:hypothetical protein